MYKVQPNGIGFYKSCIKKDLIAGSKNENRFGVMIRLLSIFIFSIFFSSPYLDAQNRSTPNKALKTDQSSKSKDKAEKNASKTDKATSKQASITLGGKTLFLSDAMKKIITSNLRIRESFFEYVKADTALLQFQKKYAIKANAEASFLSQAILSNTDFNQQLQGSRRTEWNVLGSVSKKFSSGTRLAVGITNLYTDSDDEGISLINIPPTPGFYRPTFFAEVEQELLKNFVGTNDRKKEKVFGIQAKIAREILVHQLSGLLVDVLSSYWQVTIAKKNLENSRLELKANLTLRNIIRKNSRIGLADKIDINQYNALVESARSKLKVAQFNLNESVRNILRQVNLSPDTKVTGITELVKKMPKLDAKKSLEEALTSRIDYKNAKREIKAAQLQKEINYNNTLPSVTANFRLTMKGQDEGYGGGLGNVYSFDFPDYKVSLKISYPFGDKSIYADARNAAISVEQSKINFQRLDQEIRDEVTSRVEEARLRYDVYIQSKKVASESTLYYRKLLRKTRQGRFNSVATKNALDSMLNARQNELDALVNFNVSLLRYYLAKGKIFSRFNIEIDWLLATFFKDQK